MKELDVVLMPWKWNGLAVAGGTSQQFAAYAHYLIGAEITTGSNAAGHAFVAYGKPWMLWVARLKDLPALAHEALHVTHGVLEGRGLKHCADAEEAYTYTMEDILRQIVSGKKWREVKLAASEAPPQRSSK